MSEIKDVIKLRRQTRRQSPFLPGNAAEHCFANIGAVQPWPSRGGPFARGSEELMGWRITWMSVMQKTVITGGCQPARSNGFMGLEGGRKNRRDGWRRWDRQRGSAAGTDKAPTTFLH
ncbi:hypothetical protein Zmor_009679 [Zophobas morio]|uniref:Uncharacterized protein n=1 Tax=Zophobas morio TaxID=2755281 RepID=A0AA38IMN5_9CUCU|nr:hypothetical protein Zmor_009679 [Zophobas morio]